MEANCTLSSNESVIGSPILKTPKSEKQINTDVRRWASVVKSHKNVINSPEVNKSIIENYEEPLGPFGVLQGAISENNKDFITCNNGLSFCQICSIELDTMLSLTNHVKTRKHEDNVIVYLKEKLPAHIHHTMEFVSFCKSDLCCNLCQEAINMSLNPHETILNIITHNMDTTHVTLKARQEEHNLAYSVLTSLAETNPEINENIQYVEKKIIPRFMCRICSKNILHSETVELLEKNFCCHFKSLGHIKNKKAIEVLTLFDEVAVFGKGSFFIENGTIICSICHEQFDTDVEKLLIHVKSVGHTIKYLAVLSSSSEGRDKVEITSSKENETSPKNDSFVSNQQCQIIKTNKIYETNKENIANEERVSSDAQLNRLLNTLPTDLIQLDCLIENDKGSITCLICNCVLPPIKINLEAHVNGYKHQRKIMFHEQREPSLSLLSSKSSLKSLSQNLVDVSYIVKHKIGGAECLVCKCKLLCDPDTLDVHLKSQNHKEMESQWLKKCPGCPSSNDNFLKEILKIPKDLRVYQCRTTNTIVPTAKNNIYDLLLKNDIAISENSLTANVDGKNCYCKLCKSLIRLSPNPDELVKSLVSHLNGKTHVLNDLKVLKKNFGDLKINTQFSPSTGKVVRSLFFLAKGGDDNTRILRKDLPSDEGPKANHLLSAKLKRKSSGSLETLDKSKVTAHPDVFVFGKPNDNKEHDLENCENSQESSKISNKRRNRHSYMSSLEIETDEATLNRRQKQVDYGKNTDGYVRYRQAMPLAQRHPSHPWTPPKHAKCSRRTWDNMVKMWRRRLHAWDDKRNTTPTPDSLDDDIKPL